MVACRTGTSRWTKVCAQGDVDTTSDKNEKENINDLDERYEKMFMELHPVTYMWRNTDNGLIHDRLHCGLISQEVNEAAENNGLSMQSFGAIGKDELEELTPDGRSERWSLNYGEFHGLEIHMIQKALKKIEEL